MPCLLKETACEIGLFRSTFGLLHNTLRTTAKNALQSFSDSMSILTICFGKAHSNPLVPQSVFLMHSQNICEQCRPGNGGTSRLSISRLSSPPSLTADVRRMKSVILARWADVSILTNPGTSAVHELRCSPRSADRALHVPSVFRPRISANKTVERNRWKRFSFECIRSFHFASIGPSPWSFGR